MSRFKSIGIVLAIGLTMGILLTAGIIFAAPRADITLVVEETAEEEPVGPSRAELIMTTLAKVYPWRIERAEFRNDDWALLMGGIWYYYANGAMLPEDLVERASEFTSSFGIYNYQSELPPWREPTAEENERYRQQESSRNNNTANNSRNTNNETRPQRQRSYHFHEGLWQAGSHAESSQRVTVIRFLGNSLTIHRGIVEVLGLVEARIRDAARVDQEVQAWIDSIGTMHGWNWRNVANSQSRSYHSYGIAIDILPKSLGGKETYWQWAAQGGREYWNIPYEDRYHPPDAVIKAFEAYGFMWGGKWARFDTMHFEYRPEVFIMSGLPLEMP